MKNLINSAMHIKFNVKLYFWKLMNEAIIFDNLDGKTTGPIDIDEILTILFEGAIIIIVYKNGAADRFPATPENIALAYKILKVLKNMPLPRK